ncbi:MAG: UvrD/REP helicase, partial [Thermoleophilia bacterium]|nr:UvrD/REP helicase [Thermoleophilia bacterium]
TVVRLEESFRSTQPVLDLANKLAPQLGGFRKELRPAAALPAAVDPPAPLVTTHATRAQEAAHVAAEAKRLHTEHGVAYEQMAVLYRINARSPEFEAALSDAHIPFTVTSGAFLDRAGARGLLRMLERSYGPVNVAAVVREAAERVGWRPDGKVKGSDEAQTLQEDLGRLVDLAATEQWTEASAFVAHVRERFGVAAGAQGVQLLTLHRAKGLEWDAVFLPRLNEKELPFKSRTSAADTDDERRLLYVGITRARRHLLLSRAVDAGKPSSFLAELGLAAPTPAGMVTRGSGSSRPRVELDDSDPLVASLREWRREEAARNGGKPAYTVFDDKTLAAIVGAKPGSLGELLEVKGVGPAKVERYGEAVLDLVRSIDG